MGAKTAMEEYELAQKRGQKENKERQAEGKPTSPAVLDDILPDMSTDVVQYIGLVEIPAHRIVGTKSAGRTSAFTPDFRPLLDPKSEFAMKWISLCKYHLSETGITDPIECFEYLGNFYVQEGNKRVSVLRHFGAPRIPGNVCRILPHRSNEPHIRAYYEFLEFYKDSRLYSVQFRRPGDYAKLLNHIGKTAGERWTEEERRSFNARYAYFLEAFDAQKDTGGVLPGEALLLWLEIHSFQELSRMSATELKNSLTALWEDVVSVTSENAMTFLTKANSDVRNNLRDRMSSVSRVISVSQDPLRVAFVHQMNPATSDWVLSHEEGREYLERQMKGLVVTRSYFGADTAELAEARIQEAVDNGAEVIFTTAPRLSRSTLKAAIQYPKIRFYNCSVDQPYSSIRTYYGRIYEAKFITGAIAGAMAQDDRIGYIASNPIFGVPASINAFALGAQMTNPRAQIELRWSCLEGTPQADLFSEGIRVISNREAPTQSNHNLDFCSYGTYQMNDQGGLVPLATPLWVWGRFYEFACRNILAGGWKEKGEANALNYWLGMDSGVIGLNLSDKLPEGVRVMAKMLQRMMNTQGLDPFFRRIVAQDGTVKNDGNHTLTPQQLLHMDWLCDNVIGQIPAYNEILPVSRAMVRELGIYRDQILTEKEVRSFENPDRFR